MAKFLLLFLFVGAFFSSTYGEKPTVLVSLAPYKFFVEKIADGTVKVHLMVPAGASAHTYEPTPKEMLAAGQADLWFTIGETFEARAGRALQDHRPSLKLVDLRKGVDLISSHDHPGHTCSNPACLDSHVWLSPRQSKIQAQDIATALIQLIPENRTLYTKNLQNFLNELDQLDKEIEGQLKGLKQRVIMVSHPAYAYFCRDYNLKQLSVEFEGRDPTPQQLTRILQEARQNQIRAIFIQPQYNNKGARLIAETIGAKVVTVDPYSEDYLNSMREIARQFAAINP
jgi:zinc transport system substrate-binding protein